MELRGQIVRSQSGFLTVHTEEGDFICHLRGKLKKGRRMGDVAAVGDWVIISIQEQKSGSIESIEPRSRMFIRMAPTPQGEYQQIMIANLDQAIFTFACANPQPRLGMIDRFLVIAEKQGIPAIIVANKIDLIGKEAAEDLFQHFVPLGYTVLYTSVKSGQGIDELHKLLIGKISLFAGPSGVGKSSLLNTIQPGLGLAVREISKANLKGKHTTVVREMFPLKEGGYIADTPGLKALALWDIEPEELDAYFPELRDRVAQCQFSNCTHTHEPGCAVRAAVEAGIIDPRRYQSYIRMRLGEEV